MDTKHNLLNVLRLQNSDKVISVRQKGVADASFVLTYLLKHVFTNPKDSVCLLLTHNIITHYQNVGKRLDFDLLAKLQQGNTRVISLIEKLADHIGNAESLKAFRKIVVRELFDEIQSKIRDLPKDGQVYVVIDDLTHLLDLGSPYKEVLVFLNSCVNLEDVTLIIGTHDSTGHGTEAGLSNGFNYMCDVEISVAPLKTGRSLDVTGVITIQRMRPEDKNNVEVYHYKALDREVKVFKPGYMWLTCVALQVITYLTCCFYVSKIFF